MSRPHVCTPKCALWQAHQPASTLPLVPQTRRREPITPANTVLTRAMDGIVEYEPRMSQTDRALYPMTWAVLEGDTRELTLEYEAAETERRRQAQLARRTLERAILAERRATTYCRHCATLLLERPAFGLCAECLVIHHAERAKCAESAQRHRRKLDRSIARQALVSAGGAR